MFQEGYDAYINCIGISDNPYRYNTDGVKWIQGWLSAQQDYINNKIDI